MEHKYLSSLPKKININPQVLLSVSIFSFVFSFSSFFLYSHHEKLRFNFLSAEPLHLLSHALNKNYVFLICNGLLIFLVTTSSGFSPSPSGFNVGDNLPTFVDYKEPFTQKNETMEEIIPYDHPDEEDRKDEDNDEEEIKRVLVEGDECMRTEGPNEVTIFIAESDIEDAESESEHIRWFLDHDDDDDDYEQDEEEEELCREVDEDELQVVEAEALSTEELNQMFEDFIRRMKEEIRISEAHQQQLVLVN